MLESIRPRLLARRALRGALLLCLLAGIAPARALDTERPLRQLHHSAWINKDGAPGEVFTMAQTVDGYLWLGTPTGLFRFDGLHFEPLQALTADRLASDDIYSLLAMPDGGLWIGLGAHGIALLENGRLHAYGEALGVSPRNSVNAITRDADGTLWAASNAALLRFDGSRWITTEGLPAGDIQSVYADRAGRIWVATRDSVVYRPRGEAHFLPTGLRVGIVAQFAESGDGSIWIAETTNAVRPIWRPDGGLQTPGTGSKPTNDATEIRVGSNALLFDADGTLWVTTLGDGLRRVAKTASIAGKRVARLDRELDAYTEHDGLSSDFTYSILQDREGDIWIGSSRGLDRFRRGTLVPVPLPSSYHALQMLPDGQDRLWIGSAGRTLARIDALGTLIDTHLPIGQNAGFRDATGAYWWSQEPWLLRRSGEHSERVALPPDHETHGRGRVMWATMDAAQRLWVGQWLGGVQRREQGQWQKLGPAQGLPDATPVIQHTDIAGRIWLGYTDNTVAMFDGGDRARLYTRADGLAVGDPRVIASAAQTTWIGGSDGIAVLPPGQDRFRMLRIQAGHTLRNVAGIVGADDGSLWIAYSDGVARIDADDLHKTEVDAEYAVPLRLFDHLDGLPGAIQQGSVHPAAVRADDGRIWFATVDGLAWVDPQRVMRSTQAPSVQIRSVTVGERTLSAGTALTLAAGTHQLRIDYGAASLSLPERLQFRYRLQGVDRDWRQAGDRRQAFYTNLDPGAYRFEVSAANADSAWGAAGELRFSIAPAYYQTPWFYALCGLAGASLLWLLYRLRLRQITGRLRQLHQERLVERERIARELHDTLLQSVQGLILRFQGAVLGLQTDDPARAPLLDTLVRANQTLAEGRERVNDLRTGNAGHDMAECFAELAQDLAKDLPPQTPTEFSLRVEGQPRRLQPHVFEELLKIGSEALRNAFRHSAARRIDVLLSYGESEFALRIQDDGRGIAPELMREGGREGHWGLAGMRERAFRLHARWNLISEAGLGTSIDVVAPASRAYEGARPRLLWRLWARG